jgi:hypothetical protein
MSSGVCHDKREDLVVSVTLGSEFWLQELKNKFDSCPDHSTDAEDFCLRKHSFDMFKQAKLAFK